MLIKKIMRLSGKDIDNIIDLYLDGVTVKEIASIYKITKYAIYYHLRNSVKKKVENPTCYKDYLVNSIIYIEEKIEAGKYEEKNIAFAQSEIRRLKNALKMKQREMASDPFITQ